MTELHPDAQRVLDLIRESGRPPYDAMEPTAARQLYRNARTILQPEPPEVAAVRDLLAPGPQGPIPLRLYRGLGTAAGAALPALVFFHGGGWVFGDLDTHDGVCRRLANSAHAAVVSVEYRVAPEHKFPAAIDDALAAMRWVAEQAASLGLDPARLAVGGDSAGGNLAAVAALDARDRGGPALRFQLLIYPAVDLTLELTKRNPCEGMPLAAKTMVWFRDLYLRNAADQRDRRASPLFARDFRGLPPAYLLTVGFDPLSTEGEAYVAKLREAGVAVEHKHYERLIHGFVTMGRIIGDAGPAVDAAGQALGRALSSP
ncbi:MAG TPA: alpha/beta hydrolase [Stellaceae bacterium]|nr:alpha/beta hydrolase [Stellaceae bacterium]